MVSRKIVKAWLFCIVLGLCMPSVSTAQKLVGVMFSGNIPYYRNMHVALLNVLKEKGLVGSDTKFVAQFPAPDPVALSNTAKKLIVGGVETIITYGYPATKAVMDKESNVPLIYVGVYDPENIMVPVGPMTGSGYQIPLSSLLRYFRQAYPISRLVVIYSSNEDDSARQMTELTSLTAEEKISMTSMDLSSRTDLSQLDSLQNGDAVFFTGSTVVHVMIKSIMAKLREKKIPAVDVFPDVSGEGILITLDQDALEVGTNGGELVARILAGEAVSAVEPTVSTSTELVFNKAEAKKLGINPPPQLVSEATRIIE